MKTRLNYCHSRNLFLHGNFKNFVHKYFKDVEFEGFEFGYYRPSIIISNWDEVKDKLPRSYMPMSVENI